MKAKRYYHIFVVVPMESSCAWSWNWSHQRNNDAATFHSSGWNKLMKSERWHAFHITGPLRGESTWVTGKCPKQRASNSELWCFLCCWSEQTIGPIIESPVITPICLHCNAHEDALTLHVLHVKQWDSIVTRTSTSVKLNRRWGQGIDW